MSPKMQFDFDVNESKQQIIVKREFAARRQVVWDCYTKPKYLDRWFAPKPLTTKTKHLDFREGGYWHYAMVTPDGQHHWNRTDYQTISPINSYSALDGFCNENGAINPDLPRAHWDVRFADAQEHAVVTTVVSYASSEDIQKVIKMGLHEGLASTLDRLDELLTVIGGD